MKKEVQLYAVECSSYSGCEGWNSWIAEDSVTSDYDEVKTLAKQLDRGYTRAEAIRYKTITVDY